MSYKGKENKDSNIFNAEQGYDLYASAYDQTLSYLNSFEQNKFLQMLGNVRGKKILDIGCGTGRLYSSLRLEDTDLTGIDISEKMLKIARKKYSYFKFLKADAASLPLEDNTFDIVMASFLIVHLKTLDKAFMEAYRVLKPGGFFLLTNINQRKAPKLKTSTGKEVIIKSFYHIPKQVISALEKAFFQISQEEFTFEGNQWIAQLIKAEK